MKKNILITGISGFLGSNAALFFNQKGFNVYGIDIYNHNIDVPLNFIKGEVNNKTIKSFNCKFDYIIHCAGGSIVGESFKKPLEEYQKTVTTTAEILEYIRENNCGAKLIYPSSAAVYGNSYNDAIKETDELNPVSPYGYYKKMVEELCESYYKNFGVKSNIIRFFSIYGEGLKKQLLWDSCSKLCNNASKVEFFGTGEEIRDWININDAVELVYRVALEGKGFDIYNGGTGKGIKIKDIIGALANNFNSRSEFIFNNKIREGDPISYIADINKQLSTGWKQTIEIESGIQNYVEWYKSQN